MADKHTYLVTGGAGFLGSHIVDKLMSAGNKVIVLDNLFTGCRENFAKWEGNPNFEFIEGDVCDPLCIHCERIYHLACPASPPHYQRDPTFTLMTCFVGTKNVLDLALRNNAKVVFTSTSEIYGDPQISPQTESYWGHVHCRGPRSCYDEGKRIAETLCYEYLKKGVAVRTARLFNSFGPNMDPKDGRVVSNFLMQALRGEDLTIYGTGEQTRSFTYAEDTVNGLMALMESDYEDPVNIGSTYEFTINEFAEKIRKLVNPNIKIVHLPATQDDPKQRRPDTSVAKEKLGWEVKHTLEEGLERTAEYFRKVVEKENAAKEANSATDK